MVRHGPSRGSAKKGSTSTRLVEEQLRDIMGEEPEFQSPSSVDSDSDQSNNGSPVASSSRQPEQRQQEPPRSRRKQREPRSRQVKIMEIRKLLNRVDCMIPRLPFSRIVRETLLASSRTVHRVTPEALHAIQEAAEAYATQFFQDSYACTVHRSRVTLTIKDMQLVRFLRGGL